MTMLTPHRTIPRRPVIARSMAMRLAATEYQRVVDLLASLGPDDWGHYTPGTREAVMKFQKAAKLPATGVVNARTWRAIQKAQC